METENKGCLVLNGVAASPGSVTATVQIIENDSDPNLFPEGAVLVVSTTNPTLIRFMMKASAIVTELGGRLSHAAIVAMELGIPCVVAVENARRLLWDGALVQVDGDAGQVYLLDAESNRR
jgi:pyruvate, water dikinase